MSIADDLDFTGERYVPGVAGNIELEHLHRYLLASVLSAGKTVLDIASGEGYGSAMIAERAERVIGIDISEEAVAHARVRYPAPNLEYRQGDCTAIPLDTACIDLVVSFETIEHHDRHADMLDELRRVLKPGGCLLISSPDKYFYSERPGTANPHHVKELYADEFKALVESRFRHVRYYGQTVAYGSVILAESVPARQTTYWKEDGVLKQAGGLAMPLFWLALASDGDLPDLPTGLFEQPVEASELVCMKQRDLDQATVLLTERETFLRQAADQLRQKDESLAQATDRLRRKDEHLAQAAEMLRQKDEHLAQAAEMLRQKDEHLAHAADMLRQKDEHLAQAAERLQQKDEQLAQAAAKLESLKSPAGLLTYAWESATKRVERGR